MKNEEYSVAKSSKLGQETGQSPIQWVPAFFHRVKAARAWSWPLKFHFVWN